MQIYFSADVILELEADVILFIYFLEKSPEVAKKK